jgi:hypothetical protein
MSQPPKRLLDNIEVVRVTPRVATAMLINGLLPPDEVAGFSPAKLSVDAIVKLLANANEVRNRTISIPQVHKWSRDMINKKWVWTGEPIQVDTDGFVRNGQHRLLAIIHSGTTQDMVVIRNVEPAAQLVIDVGRPRSIANQMHMANVASASIATSVTNLLLRWRAGKLLLSSFMPSVQEVHELIQGEDELQDAISMIYRMRKTIQRMPLSALGAAFVEGGHVDGDARDRFFEGLITGADLSSDNPILVLRNTLSRQLTHSIRGRRVGQLYQIVHAWNTWRKDETVRMLRIPSRLTSDKFPKMH